MIHPIGEVGNLIESIRSNEILYLGSIWINMNYMVLSSLQYYGNIPGPHADRAKEIYRELRMNIVKNMYRVYEKTGHVWEQYDEKTGQGKGSHPFTGWSSLIVLIMSELYD